MQLVACMQQGASKQVKASERGACDRNDRPLLASVGLARSPALLFRDVLVTRRPSRLEQPAEEIEQGYVRHLSHKK